MAGEIGIDPHPLTLRQLADMVRGRRRAEWDRVASLGAWIAATGGVTVDPLALNPYRPVRVSPERAARDNRLGWAALDRHMKGVSRGRRGK